MKKINLVVLLVMLVCVLGGCNQDMNYAWKDYVSEYCECYFVGETEGYYVELMNGEREVEYYLDGVSGDKQKYTLLIVTPKNEGSSVENIGYCVEYNGNTVEGSLSESPFDNTKSSEVDMEIGEDDTIFVYIKLEASTQVCKVQCVSKDFALNWEDAMMKVYECCGQELGMIMKNHNSIECYLQVINKYGEEGWYYWCVTIIADTGEKYVWIVDPMSAEILAKNL